MPPEFTRPLAAGAETLITNDGSALWWPDFLTGHEAAALFDVLRNELDWQQHFRWSYGRYLPAPRLTAWYGPVEYAYSGIAHQPADWPEALVALRQRIEAALGGPTFNSVLCNLYRDGADSVSWHADDEPPLGPRPTLASLNLGAARRFVLRRRADHTQKVSVILTPGSLLVMAGPLQRHWEHQVPKTGRPVGPRVNLTFRTMAVA